MQDGKHVIKTATKNLTQAKKYGYCKKILNIYSIVMKLGQKDYLMIKEHITWISASFE